MTNTEYAFLCGAALLTGAGIRKLCQLAKAAWDKRFPAKGLYDDSDPEWRAIREDVDKRMKALGIGKYKKANEKDLTS